MTIPSDEWENRVNVEPRYRSSVELRLENTKDHRDIEKQSDASDESISRPKVTICNDQASGNSNNKMGRAVKRLQNAYNNDDSDESRCRPGTNVCNGELIDDDNDNDETIRQGQRTLAKRTQRRCRRVEESEDRTITHRQEYGRPLQASRLNSQIQWHALKKTQPQILVWLATD